MTNRSGAVFSTVKAAGRGMIPLLLCLCLTGFRMLAQDQDSLTKPVISFSDSIIASMQKGINDSVRFKANALFDTLLHRALVQSDSFNQKFDSLKNLSIVSSPDHKLKLYTWTLAKSDGSAYFYFGYLQVKDKSGSLKLYTLKDSTNQILKPESEKLNPERWYGCVYYSIIPVKKSGRIFYTLLGWKGVDQKETRKLIEILYLDKENPRMGYPLLKTGRVFRNRMIYSYKAEISMVLRYESGKKMIVMDHLTNSSHGTGKEAQETENYSGPDGSYDGFKFKSGRWILQNDIDIRTTWKPKKNVPKPFGEEEKK